MKLYVWRKGFLTLYSDGLGVAVAGSVEAAREALIAAARDYDRDDVEACVLSQEPEIFDVPFAVYTWGGE